MKTNRGGKENKKKTSIQPDIILSNKDSYRGHIVVNANSILNLETNEVSTLPTTETNDQHYITEELSKLVTHCTIEPDERTHLATKQDVYFINAENTFKATVYWLPNSTNPKISSHARNVIGVLCSKTIKKKMTRKKANGTSFEFGIGEQAGRQSSSINVEWENYKMPYIRNNLEIGKLLEDVYGPLERELVEELSHHFPESVQIDEIAKGYFEGNLGNKKPIQVMKSVQWPSTNGCLPFSQRSLRLNGNWKSNEWLNDLIGNGGSTLHCDSEDAANQNGNYIFYFNPDEETLPGTDLLLFQDNKGGRCIRVRTMVPGWTCVVKVMSTHILHASVFPKLNGRKYRPEDFYAGDGKAFRVNCYTMRGIVKLACLTSSDELCEELFKKWISKIEDKETAEAFACLLKGNPVPQKSVWRTRHHPVFLKIYNSLIEEYE